jgi:hypothetical protein
MLSAILPWTARNQAALGGFVFTSSDGPWAFFSAHNDLANGHQHFGMTHLRQQLWPDLMDLDAPWKEAALAREQIQYSLKYIMANPVREMTLIPPRIVNLFAHDHEGLNLSRRGDPSGSTLLLFSKGADGLLAVAADTSFFIVLGLSAMSLVTGAWRGPIVLLPATIGVTLFVHGVLFFGDARYHAAITPALACMAAFGYSLLREPASSSTHGSTVQEAVRSCDALSYSDTSMR